MPRSIPWSDKEVKMLKELAEAGVFLEHAVKVFTNRSANAVELKARDLGLVWADRKVDTDDDLFKQLIKDAGKKKCI